MKQYKSKQNKTTTYYKVNSYIFDMQCIYKCINEKEQENDYAFIDDTESTQRVNEEIKKVNNDIVSKQIIQVY